jgi:sialate O-acetylesterase
MFTLPPIISEGMIIQQGVSVPIWGRFHRCSRVKVTFLAKTYWTQTDDSGDWQITLDPALPGGPYSMSIVGPEKQESVHIENIQVGDVWLCSGQSNMELSMARLRDDFPEEFELPRFPRVSQFLLPYAWDFAGPRGSIPEARWVGASPASLAGFSGTAWFFAKYLSQSRSVPMGLVVAAVGGAPIESLMSKDALAAFPRKIAQGEAYANPLLLDGAIAESLAAVQAWDASADQGDRGLASDWFMPQTDDSSWPEIELPGSFDAAEELGGFCGALWLRRRFLLPAGMEGKELKLWMGTIVDADRAYVNGVMVGTTAYRYPPRKYSIPAGVLRKGENQICLRVVCTNGEGRVTLGKPFSIFSRDQASERFSVDLQGPWKYKIGTRIGPRPEEFRPQWQPMALFNGMIAPLLRWPFRGVIWYQGEANTDEPEAYAELFASMIVDWRRKMRREYLPFIFVQLPLFGRAEENNETSHWAMLREAQESALRLPATAMAVALDLGEWNDLHPLNKKDVGYRLSLAAAALVDGELNGAPGPILRKISRRGDSLLLQFDNCGTGLAARNFAELPAGTGSVALSVVTAGGDARRLEAEIEQPSSLRVHMTGIESPKRILYAWADNPKDRQLYNSDGLPALPFKVDIPR